MRVRYWGASPIVDRQTIAQLRQIGEQRGIDVEVEYVDVLVDIERCVRHGVVLTPTIERVDPPPAFRLPSVSSDPAVNLDRLLSGQ